MSDRLPTFVFDTTLSKEDFFELESFPLVHGWIQKSAPKVEAKIAFDPQNFFFLTRVSGQPGCDMNLEAGSFVEGLWNRDVAEIFIADAETGEYEEWNVSPTGAWWRCFFERARVPVPDRSRASSCHLELLSRIETLSFQSGFIARRSDSKLLKKAPAQLRINICAISGEREKSYFSFANLPGENPDFHQPGSFLKVDYLQTHS